MKKRGTLVVAGHDVNAFPLLDKGGKKPAPKGKGKKGEKHED